MLKIFSFLSYYEIVRNVRPVCKRWKSFSYNKTLMTDLKFGTGFGGLQSFNAHLVRKLIRQAHLLRSFEYYSQTSIGRTLLALSGSCPGLRVLELSCRPPSCDVVNTLVLKCPLITCLSLFGIRGRKRDVFIPFTNLKHLRVLQIEGCPFVDDEFITALKNNRPQLETLHLLNLLNVSEFSLTSLLRCLQPTLTNLGLDQVHKEAFDEVFNCELLEMCFLGNSSRCIHCTLTKFAALPNVRSLRFLESVSPYSIQIHEAWPPNPFRNLTEAIFCSCLDLNDGVLNSLAINASLLSILFIERCPNVTEMGVLFVTSRCRNLTHLYLAFMNLGTFSFPPSIEDHPLSLRVLALFNCQLRPGWLSDFISRRPNNLIVLTETNGRFDSASQLFRTYPSPHQRRIYIDCERLDENKYPVCPKPSSCLFRRDL